MRARREELGLTQRALGRLCGVHVAQISKFERGVVWALSIHSLLGVLAALDMRLEATLSSPSQGRVPDAEPRVRTRFHGVATLWPTAGVA